MSTIKLEIDREAGVAYVKLSEKAVVRTVEHGTAVFVDLDAMNVAVGIELLDLDCLIPFSDLVALYHVDSQVVDVLRKIQPTINKFMQSFVSRTAEGVEKLQRASDEASVPV